MLVRAGSGPRILLVHGSAADRTTWSIQLTQPGAFELVAYDRSDAPSVEDAAREAATYIETRAVVVGSSYGAVVVLELLRSRPDLVAGALLIEPPMAADDSTSPAPVTFLAELDRRAAAQGGPAAAELFLRTVLGDATFERMPRAFQERATAKWAAIRADSAALIAYRPRYAELARVAAPVLLVGGDKSPPYFAQTLDALERALPNVSRVQLPAGHMLHAEAPRKFGELLTAFATRCYTG